jgi:radical SAM enzyme (TIGR04100 family)
MNNIVYQVHRNLYLNLTNRCPCACVFCLRQTTDRVGQSDRLWLTEEPCTRDVIRAFDAYRVADYEEIVFCGFGEPTERIDTVLEIAEYVKAKWKKPVRLNTNGLGNLINGRDIVPDLSGRIDTVSISLNTPDKDAYLSLVRPKFGEQSFDAMLQFAAECVRYVPKVVLTTVDTTLTKEQEAACAALCADMGATYRIRAWAG